MSTPIQTEEERNALARREYIDNKKKEYAEREKKYDENWKGRPIRYFSNVKRDYEFTCRDFKFLGVAVLISVVATIILTSVLLYGILPLC